MNNKTPKQKKVEEKDKYTKLRIIRALDRALQDSYINGIKTQFAARIGSGGYNQFIIDSFLKHLDSDL